MKKLIVLIAFLIGYTATFADYDPTTQQTFKQYIDAYVIWPLSITAVPPATHAIPDIYGGTTRDLSGLDMICVFDITKEDDLNIHFQLNGPATMDGVTLHGDWYWTTTNPVGRPATGTSIPDGTNWSWGAPPTDDDETVVNGQVEIFCYLKLTSLVALDGVNPGGRTFTISCSGSYDAI